ncbi:MAG: universal stress protein [Desulfofustis sp.]|jgi:nucleotide-binding universal stress UspA family protein
MTQQKILTAIDGSEYSSLILDSAIEQARLLGGQIILVHCHRKFSVIESHAYREEEMAQLINEAEKLVDPYLQRIRDAGIPAESRIMEEPAAGAISDIARIEKCDLIVMGSRGLTNLAGLIIGSVTNRVLQTAPCSVLVVR